MNTDTMNITENKYKSTRPIPEGFQKLPIPLPPMLCDTAGVSVDSRFISLYYRGSKAIWADGRSLSTFSFFYCWQPLISHICIEIRLWPYHLGADDLDPTHALLLDRENLAMFVGDWGQVQGFVESQHPPAPPLTPEEEAAVRAELLAAMEGEFEAISLDSPEFAELQRQGLFEAFGPPSPQLKAEAAALVGWLDEHITEALLMEYVQAARAGDYRALLALERFDARCTATLEAIFPPSL